MKNVLFTTLIVFLGLSSILKAQNLCWAKAMGENNADHGNSIALDDSGNVYTAGSFFGTVDFDPGAGVYELTSAGFNDMFVHKLDASGNFIWAKSIGGIDSDLGYSIAVDDSGNVYTTGCFRDTVDFDPGAGVYELISAGLSDVFVQKLDASGNFIWAKAMEGIDYSEGYSIAVDDSENVYTIGCYRGTVDFDPGAGIYNLTSAGVWDIFIQKLDSNGNFVWTKVMGGPNNEDGKSIAVDTLGNVYTTGTFYGTVDFDPGAGISNLTAVSGPDIFVQKLDASGNFLWVKQIGGNIFEYGNSIIVDHTGNVYVVGSFWGTVDFDPGVGTYELTSIGLSDIFIQKLDPSGSFLWAKAMGEVYPDEAISIAVDHIGNVYTTGHFTATVDFDPGVGIYQLASAGDWDIFVQKLDTSGNFLWAKAMGGINYEEGKSIIIDDIGNIYITGSFDGTSDFDPGTGVYELSCVGGEDIFVLKLSPYTYTAFTDSITACDSITWIDGNTYTSSNYTATYTLINASGCDSIISLYLTINTVDISVTNYDPILTANAIGATYQWLNCSGYTIISGATNATYSPVSSGSYACEIIQNGCVDTTACYAVVIVGIDQFGSNVLVYPNPTTGLIQIDFGATQEDVLIEIFDSFGHLVSSKKHVSTKELEIEIEGEVGIYTLKITSGDFVKRISVSKL